eukprot:jgi/Botrbrau1/463/Bobra.110_2s0106.2
MSLSGLHSSSAVEGMELVSNCVHTPVNVPIPPLVSLIPGHAPIFATSQPHRVWAEWSERLGGDFYARLGPVHVLFVSNPLTAKLLHSRSLYPHTIDRGVEEQMKHFDAICTDSNTPNLISCHTTDHWKLVRRGLAPAFGPDSIKKEFHHIVSSANKLTAALKASSGKAINIDAALQRAMLDVLSAVGFGGYDLSQASGLSSKALMDLLSDTIELGGKEVCRRMANPMRPSMGMWHAKMKMDLFKKTMRHLLAEMKARAPFPDDDLSIVAHLFRIRDERGQPLSDNELHSQISAIFFGGTDSTTHTMAYTLAFISEHKHVQEKILEELQANNLVATKDCPEPRSLSYGDVHKLPFLTATIKESMRMAPVIPLTARKAHKDIILPDGKLVPAGTAFILNSAAMHNQELYYPDAALFQPERWLQPGAEYLHEGGCYYKRFMPFGEGLRSCLGQNLAVIAMRTILAHLLGRYTFKLSGQTSTMASVRRNEYLGSAVYPNGGLWMEVYPYCAASQRVLSKH